jgi:hypothetical protein
MHVIEVCVGRLGSRDLRPASAVPETDASPAPAAGHIDPRHRAQLTSRANARIEQVNTQIRLIARRAFGFHSPHALIALAMLKLADLCPPLPQ